MIHALGSIQMSRRSLFAAGLVAGAATVSPTSASQQQAPQFALPIGWPGRVLGDGFWIRHGFSCENTWYNPGWWHTGEDWYALEGETAGAGVFAIGEGRVVFVGSEYPGRVVIVEHPDGLNSMYGHLDHAVQGAEGEVVERGQQVGAIFLRTDGNAPSHLHFEVRNFLFNDRVNGSSPENRVTCGVQCAPGPGYWPISSPDHPSALGWRNPTHVIAGAQAASLGEGAEVVVAEGAAPVATVRSVPRVRTGSEVIAEIELIAGDQYPLLDIRSGPADSQETSAEAYSVWYRIELPGGEGGWLPALNATSEETGSDGRPSALRHDLLVAVEAGA
jgi:murein DD-endopeptidase MepM/ murein hydrolase activator NlpD